MAFDIRSLAANDDLEGVQRFIYDAKQEGKWIRCSNDIEAACRDAILRGNERIVRLFLNEGLLVDSYVYESGDRGYIYPLTYFAAKVGNLSMVKLLVDSGAEIKDTRRFGEGRDNQHAMRIAIKEGRADIVQYLLEQGGSSNGVFGGLRGQTFLGKAAFDGNKHIVDLLFNHGARISSSLSLNNKYFRKLYNSYKDGLSYNYSDEKRSAMACYCSETKLAEWDSKKQQLIDEMDLLFQQYSDSIKIMLDYAMGTDFKMRYDALNFLRDLDISGFNFIGLSIDGQPITREMLIAEGLQGVDKAIVTINDIANIEDIERRNALERRLASMYESQGEKILAGGIVDLVPLGVAAEKGNCDTVQVRLSAGVSPNQSTSEYSNYSEYSNRLAIVAAAAGGFLNVVTLLSEHPAIDRQSRVTAAVEARKHGHIEICRYLERFMDVNEKDKGGNALIHKAVEAQDLDEVERLIKRGADVNLENGKGLTPLSIVASAGHMGDDFFPYHLSSREIELLKRLLEHDADPNKYKWDYSPLCYAAKAGSLEAMVLLLPVTKKRDIIAIVGYEEIRIPWYVPLIFKSFGSDEWLQILSLLKKNGADLNAKDHKSDETLLKMLVEQFPSFDSIEYSIDDSRSAFEKTINALEFLLANGADPNIPSGRDQNTPLHYLAKEINLEHISGAIERVINLLLKYGANANASNANGYTPLHFAAAGSPRTTELLIKAGADLNALDEKGRTPLDYSKACLTDKSSTEEKVRYIKAQSLIEKAQAAQ